MTGGGVARRRPARAAARLADVARLAGVSTATVSRALNTPGKLDAGTLARVERAVGKLRYVRNGQARALRSQRSLTIGAVVPSFDYALYARTTSALEAELESAGYALILGAHRYDLKSEVRVTRALIERGVDAFMFVGTDHDPELYALLDERRRPYVLAWGLDRSGRHATIGFDSRAATRALTEHLLALGHRAFGLISAPHEGNDRARERSAGVRAGLAAGGLAALPGATAFTSISLEASAAAMERILALPDRPTAVVATNDVLAVGAMLACRRHGVRIPEDVSIAGVDNTELGATQTPGLTSVRTPIVEIGRASAAHLVARLEGRPVARCLELPFDLVPRGSTGPAPAAGNGRRPRRRSAN